MELIDKIMEEIEEQIVKSTPDDNNRPGEKQYLIIKKILEEYLPKEEVADESWIMGGMGMVKSEPKKIEKLDLPVNGERPTNYKLTDANFLRMEDKINEIILHLNKE